MHYYLHATSVGSLGKRRQILSSILHTASRMHGNKRSFDDHTSEMLAINNGIGQGTYVDDNFFMAIADTFEDCDTILNNMFDKQDKWSAAHNSHAELSKYQCLRLSRRPGIHRPHFKRNHSNQIIKCVPSARLLGVEIDQELRWHQHVQTATAKAKYVRRLYISMVIPKVEYTLPTWYTPLCRNQQTNRQTRV
ncbi:hypothetical protein K439DRAFT_413211 [Ramaria rubella]|nr:hypothetical protein K439DRAFT_413211 [Ramaria rubella]